MYSGDFSAIKLPHCGDSKKTDGSLSPLSIMFHLEAYIDKLQHLRGLYVKVETKHICSLTPFLSMGGVAGCGNK